MSLRWTRRAFGDLDSIFDAISADRPAAAKRVVREILAQIETLKAHPYRGRPGRLHQTRELVVSGLPYVVVYAIAPSLVETAPALTVLRILHAAMRWPPAERG